MLLEKVLERLGPDSVACNHRCTGATQDAQGVTVHFADAPSVRGAAAVGCDGIHSALRKQFYPDEGAPRYSGVNMWRGTARWKPFLSGASMVRAGWLAVGKMVIYPIRNDIDAEGHQLVNWVAEIHAPQPAQRDWSRTGRLEDFLPAFADWHFDWLDVPALIRASDTILEYPMVDQDPLSRAGPTAASRCWATRRIRWCRAAPTARGRQSSTRAFWPAHSSNRAWARRRSTITTACV